jgi:hypothetical protein
MKVGKLGKLGKEMEGWVWDALFRRLAGPGTRLGWVIPQPTATAGIETQPMEGELGGAMWWSTCA